MLLRELFESILLEYNRDKTAATFGKKLLKAFIADRSVIQGPLGTSRQYLLQIQGQEIGPHEKQSQQMIINDILSVIEQGDPTQHKEYSQWLVKCYANEDVILEDIISKGRDWLEVYDEMKRRKILPAHYRDIMKLKFKDLYYVIIDPELVAKLNSQSADVDKGNSKVVFENAAVRIIKPEDETAACYYGQGTTWCTAARNNNMFNYYHKQGPMYILLPKQPNYDGEKYQIHLQSGQFMNEEDDPINFYRLITDRFPSTIEFFKKVEPDLDDWIVFTDPRLLETIGEQIRSITMDRVWEIIFDWEVEDENFREWQLNTAKHEGIINDEMTDDEIWDKIHEDPGLNDYLDFNMEAQEFFNDVQKAVTLSPREMIDFADNINEYESEEPLKYTNLEAVFTKSVHDYFGRNQDGGIAEFVSNNIDVSRDGHVRLVHRV